jgi:hypothetical protein
MSGLKNMSWDYTPFFTAPRTQVSLPAPHGHSHSCVVPAGNVAFTFYNCPGGRPVGTKPAITNVGILEFEGEYARIQRHTGVGWVLIRDLFPLMRFDRMGALGESGKPCKHTKLRTTGNLKSSHVKTAQGSNVEIPDGHLVALLDEQGDWLRVAVILDDVQYTGFVRRAYVHEAQF